MFLVLDDATATAIQQRRQDGWNNNNANSSGRASASQASAKLMPTPLRKW